MCDETTVALVMTFADCLTAGYPPHEIVRVRLGRPRVRAKD
jgi:hypothetical protein